MKICVWLNKPIDKNSGGVFTYMDTLIDAVDNYNFDRRIELIFIGKHTPSNVIKPFINITEHQTGISFFAKVFRRMLKLISKEILKGAISRLDQKEKRIKDETISAYLKQQGIKMIFYPMQQTTEVIIGIPYILNNWDLGHYTTYAFPEIMYGDGFNTRNAWYKDVLPSALLLFTETEAGKNEILQYLDFNPDKIKILPIFTSNVLVNLEVSEEEQLRILKNWGMAPQQFFFYPAQFWAHKNHYTLIKAFEKFHLLYPDHKLLFCGSDKGNLPYIMETIKERGLTDNVIFAGFIDDNALYTLYKKASALVMPTFFGPSNIPPIEALLLHCPALCSDIAGHKEIMGDAALYFDPLDELAILENMKAVMDESTREQIIQNQKGRSKTTDHTIERALVKLEAHFLDAINIRSCWE